MRVALIAGGPSSEAEVSRASARGVARALLEGGHEPHVLELDGKVAAALVALAPQVVFPVTHGTLGEDGCLQGLLEVLGLPYVGSAVLASALAADKAATKRMLASHGVPLLASTTLSRVPSGDAELSSELTRLRAEVGGAFVVKPVGGGSAIGVTIVRADDEPSVLRAALEQGLSLDRVVLVEKFHQGHEVTCGVLEDEQGVAQALPPTLIRARAAGWYDFTSKYGTGGSEHVCPAPFDVALTRRIQDAAVLAHRALGCRDLSRIDFVVPDAGDFVVLEVNTLPGMTGTSLFPEAAAAAGVSFVTLCDRLVRRAAERPARIKPAAMPLPA
jgi:D-alanine-D-alanine ligase